MPGGGVSAGPLPEGVLDEIEALYLRGLFLQARAAGEQHRPMRAWRGPRALLLASRLCDQLGDSRRAQALTALAWRGAPRDLSVRTAYARRLLARAGPYSAWQLVRRHGDVEAATRLERAEWLGLEATILAMLRDFPTARSYMARALADAPEESWLWVEQSFVLTAEDRQDEALTAARRALELRPRYAAAVHATVESLRRLARLDEALTLLRETVPVMESFLLTNYLVGLLVEREAYAEAEPHARRLAELAPLLRPPGVAHLRGIASDIAYHLGDDTTALTLAREAGPGFHARIALNLETWKGPPRRVRLPVPFVQQHF